MDFEQECNLKLVFAILASLPDPDEDGVQAITILNNLQDDPRDRVSDAFKNVKIEKFKEALEQFAIEPCFACRSPYVGAWKLTQRGLIWLSTQPQYSVEMFFCAEEMLIES